MTNTEHNMGKLIAALRKERGMTQAELGKALNVEDKTISKWECNGGHPDFATLPKITEFFHISLDYLMTGKEHNPPIPIIVTSKFELCAKNDDLQMFHSFSRDVLLTPNEDGKTLLDYILEYMPPKVMREYLEKTKSEDIRLNLLCDTLSLPISKQPGSRLMIDFRISPRDDIWCDYRDHGFKDKISSKYYNKNICTFIFNKFALIQNASLELYFTQFPSVAKDVFETAVTKLPDKTAEAIIDYLLLFKEHYNARKLFREDTRSRTGFSLYFSKHAEAILEKGYIELAKRCDNNLDTSKIELAELKKSGKDDSMYAKLLRFKKNGVLSIGDLLATNDYKLIKYAFDTHEDIILGKHRELNTSMSSHYVVFVSTDNGHHMSPFMLYSPPAAFLYRHQAPCLCYDVRPVFKNVEEAFADLNKCLKNNILALIYTRTNREKFNQSYKMSYICDFYNRHLYEDCITAAYFKLKEFFEIACGLSGTMEEMLEKYYTDFEPGSIREMDDSGEIMHSPLIKNVLQEILTAYNKVQNGSFHSSDMFHKRCLYLLGKIYNEEVYIHIPSWDD